MDTTTREPAATRLVTTGEAAHMTGVSRTVIAQLIDKGTLPYTPAGRRRYINPHDLHPFMPPPGWDTAITVPDAAADLRMDPSHLWVIIANGFLPVLTHPAAPGQGRRIPRDAFDAFKAKRTAA